MPSLAIIKLGTTVANLIPQLGDFENWFANGLGWIRGEYQVVRPDLGEDLPSANSLQTIVLTGSSAMATDRADWSVRTTQWLPDCIASGCHVLGVCYGHHLLAEAFGGRVDWNPTGREIGTIEVELTEQASSDPLLRGLPSPITVQATHSQSVVQLPREAVHLAGNAHDSNQAFRMGETAWGMQFHPEFEASMVRGYLVGRREQIAAEGIDVDAKLSELRESVAGRTILQRFRQLSLAVH